MRRELVDLWIRVVLLLPKNIWHSIDDTEEFSPTIRSAISLSTLEYQRLLQASDLIRKHGGLFRLNYSKLDELRVSLQGNFKLHISKCIVQEGTKNRAFLSVNQPNFVKPSVQFKTNYAQQGIQPTTCLLDETDRFLINNLPLDRPFEHQIIEQRAPMLRPRQTRAALSLQEEGQRVVPASPPLPTDWLLPI